MKFTENDHNEKLILEMIFNRDHLTFHHYWWFIFVSFLFETLKVKKNIFLFISILIKLFYSSDFEPKSVSYLLRLVLNFRTNIEDNSSNLELSNT